MSTFTFSSTSTRNQEELFAFFADMRNAKGWDPSISKVTRIDEGPVALGSSFEVTLGFLGRDLVLTYEIVTFDAPTTLVLRATSSLFISEDTVTLTPDGDHLDVRYQASLRGTGAARLLDPLFKLSIDHFGRQAGRQLEANHLH